MKRTLLLIVLMINFYSHALAYPISPRPLRMLVAESRHIVIGHVIKVENVSRKISKKRTETETFAIIVIKERLQGSVIEDTLRIEFEPNMICPAPAMYFENSDVLAFLDGEKGKYSTHALSYGAKTLDAKGLEVYKERILEMQSILKNQDKMAQLKDTIEWLVKCGENEYTQWEGTFELSPNSHFMSFYSQEKPIDFELLLSSSHKERLKAALLRDDDYSYADFGLIDLIYKGNENELDTFMIKALKATIDEKYNWAAQDYMKRLVHLNNCDEANQLIKEYDDVIMSYDENKKGKGIILKFISLIEKQY